MAGGERSATQPDVSVHAVSRRTDDRAATHRQRLLAIVSVALIALLGTGLRAAQAAAYLPWEHHWDEITNVAVGEDMAANLDPDPGFYDYPALIFLAQAVVLIPAAGLGNYDPDAGDILSVQADANARVDESGVLLAMRWVAGVVPGVVTLVAAALIAWTVTRRWWTSALAAMLVALSAVDLRYGAFVTPDALSGMAATLAALGAVRVAYNPSRRNYLLTGAAIGLAASAKYNAAAVAVTLVIAHLITHKRPFADRRPLLEATGVAAAVFAVVNIGAVFHPVRFVAEIGSEGVHYGSEQFGSQGNTPVFNAYWLWVSFGLGLVLAACGLASRCDRVRQATYVLGGFAAGYYVFVSAFPVRFARNLLPVTGAVAAAAAIGLFVLVERLGLRVERPAARVATAVVATVAVLAVPALGAASATASITEDPWSEAREHIAESIPEGSTVAVEARAPFVDPDRYEVVRTINLAEHDLAWYRNRGVDALVAVDVTFQPFLDDPTEDPEMTANYRELLDEGCVTFEAEGGAFETQDSDHRIVVLRLPPC